MIRAVAESGHLSQAALRDVLERGLAGQYAGARVLVLIPDHTRSLPLPDLFRMLVEVLHDTRRLDFMVALGTHPPLDEEDLSKLVGMGARERRKQHRCVGLFNHCWDDPSFLANLGTIEAEEMRSLAGPGWHSSLPSCVPVQVNKAALEYDRILILGPTFPHEVVGYSGGAKYMFPGISGPEMIHATHWLGALSGVVGTIGIKDTPVRRMIHAAARRLPTPVELIALTVEDNQLSGVFVGDVVEAWDAAAELSSERHIRWCERPYRRVLSCAPSMYDELWTAAKAMYKLEPAVACGGEVVIYAPHLREVSRVHGKHIHEVGYHILPYFLSDWERFRHVPLGVLAHSTHLRGSGVMQDGIERPNVRVTLASQISADECAELNLGYIDPASIRIEEWEGREQEGVLVVPHAGETLYKLRTGITS
ncbi:MAG: lactate racemase domain-containing protein [Anaerolineae bacterium]